MKKFNDTKFLTIFAFSMLVVGLFVLSVTLYSKLSVEPKAKAFIEAGSNAAKGKVGSLFTAEIQQEVNNNYRKAYKLVSKPQLFALNQYFDEKAFGIKATLKNLSIIYDKNENFAPDYDIYLYYVLGRRMAGSRLGCNSAIFFLMCALLGFVFLFIEKRKERNNK